MRKNLHKTITSLTLLLLGTLISIASPRLQLIPTQNPIVGNNALSLIVVLDDGAGGDVNNIHTLRFQIESSSPNGCFSRPGIINVNNSWLPVTANVNSLADLCPSATGGISNWNISNGNISNGNNSNGNNSNGNNSNGNNSSSTTSINLLAPNILNFSHINIGNLSGHGQVALLGSIMTIDELVRPDDDRCVEFTTTVTHIELITKVDLSTNDITSADIITSLPNTSTTVLFCPKCEANDITANPICTNDGSGYFVKLDFNELPNSNYELKDQNNQTPTYDNTDGTYLFGPYPNNTAANLSMRAPNNVDACSINLNANCALPLVGPTCNDHIMNQNENGVDCDGVCQPCLDCGINITHNVIALNDNTWQVRFSVTGANQQYDLIDDLGNSPQFINNEYLFGPYSLHNKATFFISGVGLSNCTRKFSFGYSDAQQCNSEPSNDVCSYATPINANTMNGPFNNYCAQNNDTDPAGNTCMMDGTAKTVWYRYTPTNTQLVNINASRCGNTTLIDYENDLQMAVYNACPAANNNLLKCADDVIDYQPAVIFEAQAGQSYYIMIDGYGNNDATGQYCLYACEAPNVQANITPSSCPEAQDGSISLNITGNYPPFTYKWKNGSTAATLTNLNAGTYTVTVTNSQGCFNIYNAVVEQLPGIQLNTEIIQATNGGIGAFQYKQAIITINNAITPYQFTWDNAGYVRYDINYNTNQITLYYTDNAIWNLTVTDNRGCNQTISNNQSNTDAFLDIQSYSLQATGNNLTGSISINVSGGTTPYTYSWSNGAHTQNINNLAQGWYSVTVTDSSVPPQSTVGWYWVSLQQRGRQKTDNEQNWLLTPNILQNNTNLYLSTNYNGQASLQLFDLSGKALAQLFKGDIAIGQSYTISLENYPLPSGIYIAQLMLDNGTKSYQKICITK